MILHTAVENISASMASVGRNFVGLSFQQSFPRYSGAGRFSSFEDVELNLSRDTNIYWNRAGRPVMNGRFLAETNRDGNQLLTKLSNYLNQHRSPSASADQAG